MDFISLQPVAQRISNLTVKRVLAEVLIIESVIADALAGHKNCLKQRLRLFLLAEQFRSHLLMQIAGQQINQFTDVSTRILGYAGF